MQASGTSLGCLLSLYDITAVAALPPDLAITTEEVAIGNAAQQLQVATLVLSLDGRNCTECSSYCGEALLLSYLSKIGIEYVPLLVLALSSSEQVLLSSTDLTCGIGCSDGYIATFEDASMEKAYEAVKQMAKDCGTKSYPLTKKWFLNTYPDFKENAVKETETNALVSVSDDVIAAQATAELALVC